MRSTKSQRAALAHTHTPTRTHTHTHRGKQIQWETFRLENNKRFVAYFCALRVQHKLQIVSLIFHATAKEQRQSEARIVIEREGKRNKKKNSKRDRQCYRVPVIVIDIQQVPANASKDQQPAKRRPTRKRRQWAAGKWRSLPSTLRAATTWQLCRSRAPTPPAVPTVPRRTMRPTRKWSWRMLCPSRCKGALGAQSKLTMGGGK